jgi:hypothetical protein
MSKLIRRTVASALVLGGVAALSPVAAQAKDPATLAGSVVMAACPEAVGAADGTGSVTGTTFVITIKGLPSNTYDFRARYSTLQPGSTKRSFSKARDLLVATDAAGNATVRGSVTGADAKIYRLDVVDVTSPLDYLAWTSDGAAACD